MADKTKTIKNATDKELDELIVRLRKEQDAQNIIMNIKRGSKPYSQLSYETDSVSTEEPIESLYHFGVRGMKWGVRRSRSRATESEDRKRFKELKRKPISSMSNAQLRTYVERANLEQQYKQLKSRDISNGRKFAQDILKEVGKDEIKRVIKSGVGIGVKKILEK